MLSRRQCGRSERRPSRECRWHLCVRSSRGCRRSVRPRCAPAGTANQAADEELVHEVVRDSSVESLSGLHAIYEIGRDDEPVEGGRIHRVGTCCVMPIAGHATGISLNCRARGAMFLRRHGLLRWNNAVRPPPRIACPMPRRKHQYRYGADSQIARTSAS